VAHTNAPTALTTVKLLHLLPANLLQVCSWSPWNSWRKYSILHDGESV